MHDTSTLDVPGWLALNLARFTWSTLHTQLSRLLSTPALLEELCQHGLAALSPHLPGLDDKLAAVRRGEALARELALLRTLRLTVLPITDERYPPSLRWIPDPPLLLYERGALDQTDGLAIAVVGSRKPSNYGKLMAQRFGTDLARHGFTVVSGLARGIDTLAHQSALRAGGRTIAVLGSGINVIYPPENRRLCTTICDNGALLSEFPLHTKPDRWNFPRRNRIISGLALGTLVVEASEHSGALHTARHTLEQGREVFAIPGRIDMPTSRGTHRLIKLGATLVESLDDILAELPEAVRTAAIRQPPSSAPSSQEVLPPDLSPEEARILALLQPEETHIDALIDASRLPAQVVASILVTLELRGLVRQFPGKLFTRL
jgi:DNA processing protein